MNKYINIIFAMVDFARLSFERELGKRVLNTDDTEECFKKTDTSNL